MFSLVLIKIRETTFEMDEEELQLYLNIVTELATSEEMTDEAIIKEVQGSKQEEQEEEVEEETTAEAEAPKPPLTSPNYHHCHGVS